MVCEAAGSRPSSGSTRNSVMRSDRWLAEKSYVPVGSRAMCLGAFPPHGTRCTNLSSPFFASTAKRSMLSSPRLETYGEPGSSGAGWPGASAHAAASNRLTLIRKASMDSLRAEDQRYTGWYICFSMKARRFFGLRMPALPLLKITSAILTATLRDTSRMFRTAG